MAADLRRELRALLIKAGLAADDAATAADVSERAMRSRRDAVIRDAFAAGLSVRSIAKVFGIGKSHAQRVVGDLSATKRPIAHAKWDTSAAEYQRTPRIAQLLRLDQALEFTAMKVTTFRRMVKSGELPAPVRLCTRRLAWRLVDLQAWVNGLQRVAKLACPIDPVEMGHPRAAG